MAYVISGVVDLGLFWRFLVLCERGIRLGFRVEACSASAISGFCISIPVVECSLYLWAPKAFVLLVLRVGSRHLC